MFVKNNVSRDINPIRRNVETLITLVQRAIAQKNTFFWIRNQVYDCFIDEYEANMHTQIP
jgi:hypothetical protein